MEKIKLFIKGLALSFLTILVLLLLIIIFFRVGRWSDFSSQEARLTTMGFLPEHQFNEQDFVDFPLNSHIRFNQMQVVASHNSYHKSPDRLRWLMVALGDSFSEANSLLYEHRTLYDQLTSGVRSFEFDVRRRKGRFEITHVPLVDDRSTSPDFKLALKEIKLWSDSHRGHVPLTIMLELKDDWMILDPSLKPWDEKVMDDLEKTIGAIFGKKLLTPDDVRGSAETLEKAILTKGWPRVKDIRGRVLVVLLNVEKGDRKQEQYRYYLKRSPGLKGRLMFICSEPGTGIGAFIKRDDPDLQEFRQLVKRNYIIRSRIDKHLNIDAVLRDKVLASGAQHLATDFPPGEPEEKTGYQFYFKGKKTVRVSPLFR